MANKILPKPGTYQARRNAGIVVYESDSGALCAALPYSLLNSDVAFSNKHTITLAKSDGTLQMRTLENLKAIFGDAFDISNPFTLEDMPLGPEGQPEFECADCFIDDSYIPEGASAPLLTFKVQWINPLGGSSGNMPDKANRDEVLKKWGKKFQIIAKAPAKTVAKPAGVAKPEPAAENPAVKAPTRKPPIIKSARVSSAEEVSTLLAKKLFNTEELTEAQQDEHAKAYYDAMDALFGVNVTAETPEQFGQLADKLGI